MNIIAKIITEILVSLNKYFELMFILNGVLLISIYFAGGIINDKKISYDDIYSNDGIIFFASGLTSSAGSASLRNTSLMCRNDIFNEKESSKREDKTKKCIIFGFLSIILAVFSFVLFSTGCFCFAELVLINI